MAKRKNILKGIFLAILSVILVFTLNSVVYMNAIRATALNPDFYEKELDEVNFYSFLKEKFVSNLAFSTFDDKRFQAILEEAITEEWLKRQINSLIRGFLSYINSETNKPSLKISTSEIKDNLLIAMSKEIENFSELPLAEDKEQIRLLKQMRTEMDKTIPDEFDIVNLIQDENMKREFKENLAKVRKGVGYFHTAFYLLILGAIILILLIAFLTKEIKSILRRIGASFFISGSSLYIGNIFALAMVSEKFPQEKLPSFITKNMLMKILQDFFKPINLWGIIFVVVGIILIGGSFLVKRKEEK